MKKGPAPQVNITRPDENSDDVILRFNESGYNLTRNLPLVFEETDRGVLLTVPVVDNTSSIRITFKKRVIPLSLIEDFVNDTWFPISKIGEGEFLIDMVGKETAV